MRKLRDDHDFEEGESVPHTSIGPNASSKYNERVREGYVQGEADLAYGEVSGFRFGFTQTGMRHETSPLGRKVFREDD